MSLPTIKLSDVKEKYEYHQGGYLVYAKTVGGHVVKGRRAGTADKDGRAVVVVNGKLRQASQVIFLICHGYLPEMVDHINGDVSDNRIENLRAADKYTNQWNSKKSTRNTSGVKGVYFKKRIGMWVTKVQVKNRRYSAGQFNSLEAAAAAVRILREKLHGEFCRHA